LLRKSDRILRPFETVNGANTIAISEMFNDLEDLIPVPIIGKKIKKS